MNSVFPTGLPFPTAFYLTLYLLTWALHWAFMHYVAAGSLWLAWATIEERFGGRLWQRPVTRTILSWSPFMLSAAVTAAVAPLLFMQILYGVPFYTANLLLNWIWMLIVPALIALFYMFYLLQAFKDQEGYGWLRVALALACVGCVLLVGGLWSTNHLIANSQVTDWTQIYAGQKSPFDWPMILARGMVWVSFAFPGLAMIAAWQMREEEVAENAPSSASPLSIAALAGTTLVGIGCGTVYSQLSPEAQAAVTGPFTLPYLVALAGGLLAQLAGWAWTWAAGRIVGPVLVLGSLGYCVALVSIAVVRESIRLAAIGYEKFEKLHADAAAIDGFIVFVLFALLNGGLIALCVWMVAAYAKPKSSTDEEEGPPESDDVSDGR